jgi:putative endonuclease
VGGANQARGAFGERLAAEWYAKHGYTVLDRNWRDGRSGELDLVVATSDVLVFCEVKSRASAAYGDPLEAIDARKLARLRRLAAAWMVAHRDERRPRIRLDAVSVLGTRVDVVHDIG